MTGAITGLWLLIAVGFQTPMYAFASQQECEAALVQVRQVLWNSERVPPEKFRCIKMPNPN